MSARAPLLIIELFVTYVVLSNAAGMMETRTAGSAHARRSLLLLLCPTTTRASQPSEGPFLAVSRVAHVAAA